MFKSEKVNYGRRHDDVEDSIWSKTKSKLSEATEAVNQKITNTTESVTDIDLSGKVKRFASEAARIVADLDEELVQSNSSYEIGDFKVSASLSVVGGMSLDIHYVKTPTARAISDLRLKSLQVKNPETGKSFNVPRISVAGRDQANVKDPHTGEVLCINVKTGEVIKTV